MSRVNDGGQAFPRSPHSGEECDDGMSLRDYFAAKAMPACLVACVNDDREIPYIEYVARKSYELADAMLSARGAA